MAAMTSLPYDLHKYMRIKLIYKDNKNNNHTNALYVRLSLL